MSVFNLLSKSVPRYDWIWMSWAILTNCNSLSTSRFPSTKVNLFKFEDLGNVAIDATQKGNNGNSNNGNNPVSPNPVYVVSNGQIINACVFDQITQNFEPVIL